MWIGLTVSGQARRMDMNATIPNRRYLNREEAAGCGIPLKRRSQEISLKKTLFKGRGREATKLNKLQTSENRKSNL
jgi:hypothetical protein